MSDLPRLLQQIIADRPAAERGISAEEILAWYNKTRRKKLTLDVIERRLENLASINNGSILTSRPDETGQLKWYLNEEI